MQMVKWLPILNTCFVLLVQSVYEIIKLVTVRTAARTITKQTKLTITMHKKYRPLFLQQYIDLDLVVSLQIEKKTRRPRTLIVPLKFIFQLFTERKLFTPFF